MNTYLNIGCDFIDSENNRVTSIQLVDKETKKSIADVLYDNEKLIKCICIDEVDKSNFILDAAKLMGDSIPVNFRETKLP
jgi:hypothetical protein